MNFSSGFRVGAAYLELWYRVQSASTPCVLALVCQVDVDQNLDGKIIFFVSILFDKCNNVQTAREVSAYSDSHHLVERLNRLLVRS